MKKSILITGCSSGIGRHCARRLAEGGQWRVFATARKQEDVDALNALGLENLESFGLDLASPQSVQDGAREAMQRAEGKLSALFNNGAFAIPGAVEDISREAWREQFETNVFGAVELTNAVLPAMRAAGGGRIVQNSSVLGFTALPFRGAYAATKFALEGITDTLRLELAGANIHAILIEPGPISSDFRKNAVAQYHHHIQPQKSAHRAVYEKLEERWQSENSGFFTRPPEAVYRALRRALCARWPRARYRVTFPTTTMWLGQKFVPAKLMDVFARLYR